MTRKIRIAPPEAGVVVTPLNAAKLELKKRLLENHRDAGYSATEIRTQLGLGGDATREAAQVMSDYGEIYELVIRRNRRYYGRPPVDEAEQALWAKSGLLHTMEGHPKFQGVLDAVSSAGLAGITAAEAAQLASTGLDTTTYILHAAAWRMDWCDTIRYYPDAPQSPQELAARKDAIRESVGRAKGKEALVDQMAQILGATEAGMTLEQLCASMGVRQKTGREAMYYGVHMGKLCQVRAKDVGTPGSFVWPGPPGLIYEAGASEEKVQKMEALVRARLQPIIAGEAKRARQRKYAAQVQDIRAKKERDARQWAAKVVAGLVLQEVARGKALVSPLKWQEMLRVERARVEQARKKARKEKAMQLTAPKVKVSGGGKPGRNTTRMAEDAKKRLLRHTRSDAKASAYKSGAATVIPEQVQVQICPPTRAGDPWVKPEDLEDQSFGAGFSRMKIGSYLKDSK